MSNRWKVAQWNDLPRFVMTLDQAISEILDPPLLTTLKDKGPDAVACHIYERLSQRGIHYTWERRSWGKEQEVRTPTEVIQTHQGTCLDLALLFASCLEAQFVHPIVVILEGHALVAFWKGYSGEENLPPVPRKNPSSQPAVLTAATVRDLLQRKQIVPVECTGFALFDRPVTLDPISECTLRTRQFPLDDRPTLPHAPGGVVSDKFRLIAYPGAKSLGTTQIQNCTVRYGVCIATARAWDIWPMGEREALASLRDREVMPIVRPVRHHGEFTSSPRPRRTRRQQGEGQRPGQHIVGRQEEMALLDKVVTGALPPVVNIYGPGGIGKTVVCQKFAQACEEKGFPYAMVTGTERGLTIRQMLSQFRDGLEQHVRGAVPGAFDEFTRQCLDHETVDQLLAKSGGLDNMLRFLFTLSGKPRKKQLKELRDSVGEGHERLERLWADRLELQSYAIGVERELTDSFIESVTHVVEDAGTNIVLLIDTYEMLEGLDGWMCKTFANALPPAVKVILLGRNQLSKQNHDWALYYNQTILEYHELKDLSEEDAKAFLRHHGLPEDVYKFTKGYPLCLVLAVEASKAPAWKEVSGLGPGARGEIARQLLEHILRQQEVKEVKDFLEQGVVTEWFDPGVVRCLLGVTPQEAQDIYDKLSKFSFVQPHHQGLQFHDTVRQILVERLQRLDDGETYDHLLRKYIAYTERPRKG